MAQVTAVKIPIRRCPDCGRNPHPSAHTATQTQEDGTRVVRHVPPGSCKDDPAVKIHRVTEVHAQPRTRSPE